MHLIFEVNFFFLEIIFEVIFRLDDLFFFLLIFLFEQMMLFID